MAVVNVKGMDELIATIPHVLGFQPTESLVVVPISPGPPVARIDLPASEGEREESCGVLMDAYLRHAEPGSALAIVCFSESTHTAELVSSQLRDELSAHGIQVPVRAVVSHDDWVDLDSGEGGRRSDAAQTLMAAEFVGAGRRSPVTTREGLAARLVGDRNPVQQLLPQVGARAAANGAPAERGWAVWRINDFVVDGVGLNDHDAARLLVAVQDVEARDDALFRITPENAPAQRALWSDMTRRAPDEVRAPAAVLAGFSSWLDGDGANAWVAIDQVPPDTGPYLMAELLADLLQQAVPPSAWHAGSEGPTPGRDLISGDANHSHHLNPPPLGTAADLRSGPPTF